MCQLAFSPEGRALASGSVDTTTLIWDVLGDRPQAQRFAADRAFGVADPFAHAEHGRQ
jgi:WD40 repeat protein